MQSGSPDHLGERTLYEGDLGYLKGFRLNPYTLLNTLLRQDYLDEVTIHFEGRQLLVQLPALTWENLKRYDKASALAIQFVCCELDGHSFTVKTHLSAPLLLPLKRRDQLLMKPKKLRMELPEAEGKVLLLIMKVHLHMTNRILMGNISVPKESASTNRKYYTAEVVAIGPVLNGQWLCAEQREIPIGPDSKSPETSSTLIEWEDDDG